MNSAPLCVAYQGEVGSYSDEAARKFFGNEDEITMRPCKTTVDMFNEIENQTANHIIVPIENNLAGTIHENLDHILCNPNLVIIGEIDLPIRHCLLARHGTSLTDIRSVRSHEIALAQCNNYLEQHEFSTQVGYDTAGSAKLLISKQQTNNNNSLAVIASRRAARIYDLDVLAEDIQDQPNNFTRFLVLSTHPAKYIPGLPSKTGIAFALITSPGILCRALSVFAVSNIDLSKIESRHIHTIPKTIGPPPESGVEERHWKYVFFVDILRHADEQAVAAALKHLQEITTYFRVLGAYPAHTAGK